MLLESVPLGVTTWTVPEVAPVGTVVVIKEGETMVNPAAMPLNVTLAAPLRSVPKMLTAAPTSPEVGCGLFERGGRLDAGWALFLLLSLAAARHSFLAEIQGAVWDKAFPFEVVCEQIHAAIRSTDGAPSPEAIMETGTHPLEPAPI